MAHANSVIDSRNGPRLSLREHRWRGEFFSLGSLVASIAGLAGVAPWILTACVLSLLGVWDFFARGGDVDAILLGLAAYELLIGLTRDSDADHSRPGVGYAPPAPDTP